MSMMGSVHLFVVVQAHRTSSNLLEPHHYKDSKVCRVLSHEFGVFRLYRTFSIYIVTGETRYEGWLCTSSGWFKHIVPRRTFSNHIITEIVRCVEFCHMSSGWFDCTEPSLSTSLQGKQGVQGAYALVRGGSSTSNLIVKFIPLQLPTNSLRRTKANGPADQAKRTKRKVRRTFCLVRRSLGPPDRSLGP